MEKIIDNALSAKPVHVQSWTDAEDALGDLLVSADMHINPEHGPECNEDLEYYIEALAIGIKAMRAVAKTGVSLDSEFQISA